MLFIHVLFKPLTHTYIHHFATGMVIYLNLSNVVLWGNSSFVDTRILRGFIWFRTQLSSVLATAVFYEGVDTINCEYDRHNQWNADSCNLEECGPRYYSFCGNILELLHRSVVVRTEQNDQEGKVAYVSTIVLIEFLERQVREIVHDEKNNNTEFYQRAVVIVVVPGNRKA